LRPLIEHWNGAAWKVQGAGSPGANAPLSAVSAFSSSSAWAVGKHNETTLIDHWDGSRWVVQPSPNPGDDNPLMGVVATAPAHARAVGSTESGKIGHTLVIRCC